MSPLSSDLRSLLERAIIKARDAAEGAAKAALIALAVLQDSPLKSMSPDQRRLRNALRAKMRQLASSNDADDTTGFKLLAEEVAYAQWHKRLFVRFLAENNLLMHPEGIAVTLKECGELAAEEGNIDAWELAIRYASMMLPGIFRADDYVEQVQLSPEGRHELEAILMGLPSILFTADDTLGWVYQFWQTKRKKEVNASGSKIGGSDLSPVTQLFTEHYMVQFLLENSLGAWWAARHPTSSLLKDFSYLRFREDGTPAAGTFPGWPEQAARVTVMDPCCGSGHFLVAAFEMLRKMRMEEEGLSEVEAADAVLRDNLFGLELDERCTQIAAFALAFAAWKAGGYRRLPIPNIACSGISVSGQLETWTRLVKDNKTLCTILEHLYDLFRNAPDLGSLIDPNAVSIHYRLFRSDYDGVGPHLERALEGERKQDDPTAAVFGAAAEGVAKAARLLVRSYTLVVTNVPYLQGGKQNETLRKFCNQHHPDTGYDLATTFIDRCRVFTAENCSYAVVSPQNWFSQHYYKAMRVRFLKDQTWNHLCRLGPKAFQTISGEIVNVALIIVTNEPPTNEHLITGFDVSGYKTVVEKNEHLHTTRLYFVQQAIQFQNPDARISLIDNRHIAFLSSYAYCYQGMKTGDDPKFRRCFWELPELTQDWRLYQSTVERTMPYGGREFLLNWKQHGLDMAAIKGRSAWNTDGIAVSQMGTLPVSLYCGEAFDSNIGVIIPNDPSHLSAIWAYCQSQEYNQAVRQIDQALKVTNATLVKVPFDLEYWQKVADEAGPLPEPYSNDPTQWLFAGDPTDSTHPLQVAVARLLGYRWPQQKPDKLDTYTDKDCIICLPSVAGRDTAVERLRELLAIAFDDSWSPALQERLLAGVGFAGRGLDVWLRDGFFAQHCKLFHNRPFIWHIWDEQPDGFSALVNYHNLDAACLERLTYTYLGSWIAAQKAEKEAGVTGAERRYLSALKLQNKLKEIREGEEPYDIYVRWKQLHEQPIGWQPDLDDGVRINIRPFVEAGILRTRFTINWNKDRGTNPDGTERLNHLHKRLEEKLKLSQALFSGYKGTRMRRTTS